MVLVTVTAAHIDVSDDVVLQRDPIAHNAYAVSREVADHVALKEGFSGGQLDSEASVKDKVITKRQLRPVSPLIHPVVEAHPLLRPPVLGLQSIVNKTVLDYDVLGWATLPDRQDCASVGRLPLFRKGWAYHQTSYDPAAPFFDLESGKPGSRPLIGLDG